MTADLQDDFHNVTDYVVGDFASQHRRNVEAVANYPLRVRPQAK
jgi:hypothetical protein